MLAPILGDPPPGDGEDTVDAPESECLFSAIDALLFTARETSACAGSRCVWNERPWISTAEIGMLMEMMKGPQCVEAAAALLGWDTVETRLLLDGMVSIGVLEICPRGYSPTIATRLYCQSLLQRDT